MTSLNAIYSILNVDSALNAVVPKSRIYPSIIPIEASLPSIAISLVSSNQETAIGLTKQVSRDRVQVTVASDTYPLCREVIDLVDSALNLKSGIYSSMTIHSIIKDNIGTDFRDDDAGIYYSTIDFRINYQ